MPNWCTNTITITGEPRTIKMFEKMLKGMSPGGGVFETLIGKDEKLDKEEYDSGGWYSHNTNRYGTKWDIDFNEHQFDFTDGCLVINCETAWSPPTEFVENLTKVYNVTCEMTYEEPGNDFAGKIVVSDGEIIQNDQYDYAEGVYHLDNEYFWDGFMENQFDYWRDEEVTDEEVKEYYSFLSEKEKEEVLTYYKEYEERHKQTDDIQDRDA